MVYLRRFNSVERILEYHQLPQEKAREIPDKSPAPAWPTEGVIQYRDVWMRYREGLDPVLKVRHPGHEETTLFWMPSIKFAHVSMWVREALLEVTVITTLYCRCVEVQVRQ